MSSGRFLSSDRRRRRRRLFFFFLSFMVALGTITFILWLIYHPKMIKAYVKSTSLATFAITNTTTYTTLSYNFALNITIQNPNKRVIFHYEDVKVQALYNGVNLGLLVSPPINESTPATAHLHAAFDGQIGRLDSAVSSMFSRDKVEGFFTAEVKLCCKIRGKVMFFKFEHSPKIDCTVKLFTPANSNSGGRVLERTKCDVD